jgi:DNA ligase (NAD+)
MKERLDQLRSTIDHHNYQYYVMGDPEIPDSVYDQMFQTLLDLERQYPEFYDPNSPTSRVGSDLRNNFNTYPHLSPMLSIQAVQKLDEIEAFTTGFDTVCELKYDGVGINLIYKGGKLFKALTRGDGFRGVDVTANIRTFAGVPNTIDITSTVEIRGEVWCPWSELRRLQSLGETVKSPIAVAINTIKMKQSMACARRHLTFTAFQVIPPFSPFLGGVRGEASHLATLHWLNLNAFNTPYVISLKKAFHIIERQWCNVNEFPNCRDVHADGLVFKHNDLEICEGEGYSTRSVNWAISWKFDKDFHEATIAGIGGKVARNGRITPFVIINPVVINTEIITKIPVPILLLPCISVGQTVKVRRVATRVARIVDPDISEGAGKPHNCPQCGSPLVHRKAHFFCSANCQFNDQPPTSEHYQFSTITQPDHFSVDPVLFQSVARENGCRLIPLALKSGKYTLFYNDPIQLAKIGYALGLYVHP